MIAERSTLRNDRGAVLISGLMLLLVLTLIGLAAMQSATLQVRMAGNLEQHDFAFQAAEAGLRSAEAWLNSMVVLPAFTNSHGLYIPAEPGDDPRWVSVDWKDETHLRIYDDPDNSLPEPLPRYFIEFIALVNIEPGDSAKFGPEGENDPGIYRITSRGVSPNGRAGVILETTFVR